MKFTFKHISGSCKYHREVGRVYTSKEVIPEDFCTRAYVAVYPYCLSLLYGAVFSWMKKTDENSVEAQCPAPFNPVIMKIFREIIPEEKRKTRKDEDRYNIYVEIIGKSKDSQKIPKSCRDCGRKMKVGKRFEFNKGQFSGICPAAFNHMFPYLIALQSGGKIDWQNEDGSIVLTCPDNISKIKFLVKKTKTESEG
jgi:uncharacterized repeat protein (TIGR04076 family)